MGATIKQHPSSLARCRAQRSEQTASEGRRCARLLRHERITAQMLSASALTEATPAHCRRNAAHHKPEITPWSNDAPQEGRPRAAILGGDQSHEKPKSKTAFKKPEKRGS